MVQKSRCPQILAETEDEDDILRRAEKMLREMLASQIKQGVIPLGKHFSQSELRQHFNDCKAAAKLAIRWEQTHPSQEWMPTYTDANRGEGLSQHRYRQYTPPRAKDN